MHIKLQKSYFKGLAIIVSTLFLVSCSEGGDPGVGPSTIVDEFTAFHPETGLPLKPEDLTEEMLQEDPYAQGEIGAMEIHPSEVDVEASKNIMLLGYTPDGSYNSHISPQCHFSEVGRMVASYSGVTSNLAKDMQVWANRCEKELSRFHTNSLSTVLKFSNTRYDLKGNSIENVEIEFDDQSRINAMLAMKPGKRPLVIFKAGVYSNAGDGGVTRNFFMHLFEESPFHILYLANVTGTDYMKKNGAVALGGMDEGRQILKIVEMLSEDPNYSHLIEDIHVAGVSLGSHGVLYSSLYNSFNENSHHKIKSSVALCPVVNLEPTIKSVFEKTIAGIYYAILTQKTFKEVYNYIPILRDLLPANGLWSQSQMYKASTSATLWHYQEKTSKTPLDMAPFQGARIQELNDFWDLNRFVDYVDYVNTPTLIVHSKDDFLVQSSFNSETIYQKTLNENSNVGVVRFDNGSHCALNVATGWATMSSLLRNFVLKHSSYSPQQGATVDLDFRAPAMRTHHKITNYKFAAERNKDYVNVDIQYFDRTSTAPGGKKCSRFDPLFASQYCYYTKTEKISLSGLEALGLSTPRSTFEVQRLTRWFNTHATLKNKNSDVILGSNLWPTKLEVDTVADFQQ